MADAAVSKTVVERRASSTLAPGTRKTHKGRISNDPAFLVDCVFCQLAFSAIYTTRFERYRTFFCYASPLREETSLVEP